MERRLLRAIMNPAMVSTYVFGILLASTPGVVDWSSGWIYAKLVLVLGLTAAHHEMMRWQIAFAEDRNTRPQRFFRIANEIPTLLMIAIVILVVVKPF
jgi:protoporphyrinogen IX oxidase